jgi:hypothetical protein
VDAAVADLDEEEGIELGQPDGVDDEEVDGEEVVGMLADKLAPRGVAAARSGREVVAAEQASDREVGAAPAKLEQFALDPAIAPARVLASQAEDQLIQLASECGPSARAGAEGRPLASDELAVPAEERLRLGEQRWPGAAREESAESGEEETIGRLPARAVDLALEDAELVAESENLSLEPELGLTTRKESVDEEADQGVEEGERHGRGIMAVPLARRPSRTGLERREWAGSAGDQTRSSR